MMGLMTGTPRLLDAKPLDGFVVYVRFEDGLEAEVDLGYLSEGKAAGVFAPLRDPDYFRKFRIYEDGATIYWPRRLGVPEGKHDNFMPPGPEAEWVDYVQADIAPETLYAHAQAHSADTSA